MLLFPKYFCDAYLIIISDLPLVTFINNTFLFTFINNNELQLFSSQIVLALLFYNITISLTLSHHSIPPRCGKRGVSNKLSSVPKSSSTTKRCVTSALHSGNNFFAFNAAADG